ncbi:hypothetical protein [Carboxylicivirga sp. N1Y90]|uniref:hypothetical protein n=1 Tax=Carboxylicivirga fragile TaxID=3417571 RepID=UPI003D33556E|nr:hypothetical protein [Marinilabiliaceae bacterium N1Y90]
MTDKARQAAEEVRLKMAAMKPEELSKITKRCEISEADKNRPIEGMNEAMVDDYIMMLSASEMVFSDKYQRRGHTGVIYAHHIEVYEYKEKILIAILNIADSNKVRYCASYDLYFFVTFSSDKSKALFAWKGEMFSSDGTKEGVETFNNRLDESYWAKEFLSSYFKSE